MAFPWSAVATLVAKIAQEFPLSAKRLPLADLPSLGQLWRIPNLLFFNSL